MTAMGTSFKTFAGSSLSNSVTPRHNLLGSGLNPFNGRNGKAGFMTNDPSAQGLVR